MDFEEAAMPVDMHMHSNASDGALKPAELVGLCARQGIRLMSLTDHDTMAGTAAARDAAKALGIEFSRVACFLTNSWNAEW